MPPGRFNPVMRPGEGAKVSGFSALMRHSMAWPRISTGAAHDVRQLLARGNQDLALHQVDAGDELRNRMLHLDARVHLDEVEVAVLVHQELDGAGVGVADVPHAPRAGCPRSAARSSGLTAGEGASSISF